MDDETMKAMDAVEIDGVKWVKPADAALLLGVSPDGAYKAAGRGDVVTRRILGHWAFSLPSVLARRDAVAAVKALKGDGDGGE